MELEENGEEKCKDMIQAVFSGKEWRSEIRHKSKNNVVFWEYAYYSPIINSEGVVTNYLKVSEDITERKLMSENLFKAKRSCRGCKQGKKRISCKHEP